MSSQQSNIKVLITGATGQLGFALQQTLPALLKGLPVDAHALTRQELDLAEVDNISTVLSHYKPDIVINTAAYTAVDKAESEPELAQLINHHAVDAIARWCAQQQKTLVQVSTDFVFNGKSSTPYLPENECGPLGVYGKTKRAGELAALETNPDTYVVRTGWVYCEQGANFVKTMLRLGAERKTLGVVSDQVGTPTYAIHLAQMIWTLLDKQHVQKIFHFSDAGVASWYDFACAIFAFAEQKKMLLKSPDVKPIRTSDYPTPATRPVYSVLDKFQTWELLDIQPVHWQDALCVMMDKIK